jgi:hypothetical protein
MRVCGSKAVSFTRHESITNEMESIVIDVSHMFVATTTLVMPSGSGLNTLFCASVDNEECTGKNCTRARLPRTGSRRM